tara:strand:+ start:15825 stop:16577 length:753 start_codon:yes stop_codon:yes gene_type:complete
VGRDAERVAESGGWAVRLAADRIDVASRLRCHNGIELLIAQPFVWLRGQRADAALGALLDGLPGGERFDVDAQGRCRVPGRYLPEAQLPDGNWCAIDIAIPVDLPATRMPATLTDRVRLRIVRGGSAGVATLLCTEMALFAGWVANAATVRFARLRMAVDRRGRVLVHGDPLPPLPGEVAVVRDGVAVAAGYRLEPAVAPDLAAKVLSLAEGDLAWFAQDGSCTQVTAEQFVAVRRSAVRSTMNERERNG